MIRSTWGERLREVFEGIEDPHWAGGSSATPLRTGSNRYEPLRKVTNPGQLIV
jgi:putative proteasome-type protease